MLNACSGHGIPLENWTEEEFLRSISEVLDSFDMINASEQDYQKLSLVLSYMHTHGLTNKDLVVSDERFAALILTLNAREKRKDAIRTAKILYITLSREYNRFFLFRKLKKLYGMARFLENHLRDAGLTYEECGISPSLVSLILNDR